MEITYINGVIEMLRKAFILLIILLLAALAVVAQEDLPDDANACNEGGSMEGKCNIDFNGDGEVSDYEVTWAWTCGWYMIRYDAGVFARNQVPVFCSSLLPAEVVDGGSGGEDAEPAYCYEDPIPGEYWIFPANPDGTPGTVEPIDTVYTLPDFPKCVLL
jgi:hypothetical protein